MTKPNVESLPIDLMTRWEKGTPHHQVAEKLAKLIGEIDYHHSNDSLSLDFGGDGDNGEALCYILSEIFERNLIPEINIKEVKVRIADDTQYKFTPNAGYIAENDSVQCGVCGVNMNVERNCFGPRSYAESFNSTGSHYDKFICPHANDDWHERVVNLRNEMKQTASRKLQEMFQSEIFELFEQNTCFNPS